MKYSASLAVAGAAVASAAAVPLEAPIDYCPVVVKTIGLSWIELEQFVPAHTIPLEEAAACVDKSVEEPSFVFPNLTVTAPFTDGLGNEDDYPTSGDGSSSGGDYPAGHLSETYSASVAVPYPTGIANYTNGYPIPPTGGLYSKSSSASYSQGTNSASVISNSSSASASATASVSASASASATSSSALTSSSTTSANPAKSTTCRNPRVRVEWSNMSNSQRDAYVAGIRCLMEKPSSNPGRFPGSRSLYEDLTSLHQQVVGQVHQSGKFLVFHRFFVYIFEKKMREECNFRGPLAWWDESKYADDFSKSDVFSPRWFGAAPHAINGRGVCVTESGFGNYEPNLGPGSAVNNPHCLSRALDNASTKGCGPQYVETCNRAKNYDAFRQCAEMTYHAYGHNGVGSVMSNVATSTEDVSSLPQGSPRAEREKRKKKRKKNLPKLQKLSHDPLELPRTSANLITQFLALFYMHHGFVDRNYRYWQNRGTSRNNEMGGAFSSSNSRQVTPRDTLPALGLVPDVTIADVMNTENNFLCYKYDSE